MGVTPEGSEELFIPWNHSKVGAGTSEGRGTVIRVAEHTNENVSPATPEPGTEMATGPNSTVEKIRILAITHIRATITIFSLPIFT
jgi:hypothetical protein